MYLQSKLRYGDEFRVNRLESRNQISKGLIQKRINFLAESGAEI